MAEEDHELSATTSSSTINIAPGGATTPALKIQALDIFRASQLGDIERCQQIIHEVGPQILLEYDERGHTAVHWACLAGHNDILRFYIQCNAPLDKPSNNELAPKPIHWACVNGHILTVDLLIQHGVSINTTDSRGCTPLILATQYGQSMLVGYLIGKGARKDFTDADGDNALHWASFKGQFEIAQMLIHVGFNSKSKDDVGQTPMHLACLSGNLDTVKLLLKQKPDLQLKDSNGKTPLDLAKGRKYEDIVAFLESNLKIDTYCSFYKKASNFLGHRKQLTLHMVLMLLIGYPLYLYHLQFLREFPIPNLLFVFLNFPMWYFFYKASKSDPGFLQRNSDAYDMTLKQVSLHKEWEKDSENNPLGRLCHTCKLVRPQRAKHCSITERCVDNMDHHCAFINNSIGPKNRIAFLIYLTCLVVCSYTSVYFIKLIVYQFGFTMVRFLFVALCGIFVPLLSFMLVSQLYCISVNLTTNEKLNMHRYEYLKDSRGNFHNPYDRGFVKNWLEFLHLTPPLKLGIDVGKEGEFYSV